MTPITELKQNLLKLNNHSYDSIDKLMRKIMKKYDITAKELHYGFRNENNDKTPDEWIKERTKMKTFNEFIDKAYSVIEEGRGSRGEDVKSSEKLAGYIGKRSARNPENSDKYWGGVLKLKDRSPVGSKILKTAKNSRYKEISKLKSEEVEMSDFIYEMRKEDKVKGKKKTPLMIPSKRSSIQRTEGEGGRKWNKVTFDVGNPEVSMGRFKQGAGGGGLLYSYKRHPHGGEHGGMKKGRDRGKKKQRGIKPGTNVIDINGKKKVTVGPKPETTPVEKFKSHRESNRSNTNYSKTFSDYNRPTPTRLDILRQRRENRKWDNEKL